MKKTKLAIIYDFDKTLSPLDMQEFHLYKELGYENPSELWSDSAKFSKKYKMDKILSYMYIIKQKHPNLSKEVLIKEGKYIKLFKGVKEWFKRINEYGMTNDVEVEHYIISSGLKSMIEGTEIADEFKYIYACEYAFDKNDIWPSRVVNYTSKTQCIFRINKGILDWMNDDDLNKSTPDEEKRIPYSNMIYIGDGFTDVPCMKIVTQFGGSSIAVYSDEKSKTELAKPLFNKKRATFFARADYSEGSKIDKIVKNIIDKINTNNRLESFK